jgi:dolichyl-diphosphooligosaccharide--protein glycosyltransferase/undecaprenyl-diphosphooligosaccharide--protein glycosyltransferase
MTKYKNQTLLYIALAFIFSFAIRLIWVYQFHGATNFMWNSQFMINTNDGYFWAEGARDLLNWTWQENSLSPVGHAASQLTAFFAFILPFSFESVIFYMPAFLSSLVVVPIILIAKELKLLHVGFIAALLSSIAWSYYNRTMVGYFDTDMLNIVFPTLLLWSLVLALKKQEEKYLLFTALEIVAYRWWYPQSYSLEFAFFGLILIYTLVYERKSIYHYKLLALMLIAMMGLPDLLRLVSVLVVFTLYKKKILDKYIYYFLAFSVVLFLATGGFSPIWRQLQGYVFGSSVEAAKEGLKLHFFTVMQTVREAGKIPFELLSNRISGHVATFLLSVIGYIWLCFRQPVMLLGLPMLGLGFLAYVGGLRFTIYAVPIMAFGIGYLVVAISEYMNKKFLKYLFLTLATLAVLYPNVLHVIDYKVPTVMSQQEVSVLDNLKSIASREDYVVAWWDYGYPIRYYADVKTLIDGGKHSGAVNFPVSFMLTNPQNIAAKLARYDVEYTERAFKIKKENKNKSEEDKTLLQSNIAEMTLANGFEDTNDFLNSLHVKTELPTKTRDIYFYLPFRMLGILPTITKFSDLDLMNGKTVRKPFIYQTNRYQDSKDTLNLGNGIVLEKQKGIIKFGDQEVLLKTFYFTAYDKDAKLLRQKQEFHKDAKYSIVFMRSYNTFLILDEDMINSTYIQLFVFENYDKNYFEPVILDPSTKIFKLKI